MQGINFTDINVYPDSLIYGVNETGPVVLNEIHGIRRPGTNRLNAGGHVAFSIVGGSFHMSNSEVSYHFDDLSDIQSGLAYAFSQVGISSSAQIWQSRKSVFLPDSFSVLVAWLVGPSLALCNSFLL